MGSNYFFSLESIKPKTASEGGAETFVTSDEVKGFRGISLSSLTLKKNGTLSPIWHPNANKIGYCLQGQAIVTVRSPKEADTFTLKKGEVFFIPKGFAHHIANSGDSEVVIKFAYDHVKPETMSFTNALHSLSGEVFLATFNASPTFLDGLKKSKKPEAISVAKTKEKVPSNTTSRYKFNIGDSNKPILTKGGYLQLATKTNLPILEGLGILGFGLNPKGVVEPHWHTNAGELVYIVKGQTKITLLSPDGSVEVLNVKGGEGAFAPASYFHNIENVGSDDVEVIAFFSHADPDYIGIGEVLGSFSNELLATVFNVEPGYFDAIKKTEDPLVIVPV